MAEPYIGEIRVFAGKFVPDGWAFCNGQLLPIAQNTALFSILGTAYGGDGKTTFALPNLMGRAPVHQGTGSGLTPRSVGDEFGVDTVTLTTSTMPTHTHYARAATGQGSTEDPTGNVFAESPPLVRHGPQTAMYSPTPNASLTGQALSSTGQNQPHNNMQPYLGLNFMIALQGVFPSRS